LPLTMVTANMALHLTAIPLRSIAAGELSRQAIIYDCINSNGDCMKFENLEGSLLEIEYQGKPLDLYTLGILHLDLQEVIDKVALGLLSQAGLIEPTWKRAGYIPPRHFYLLERILKAEVKQIKPGSLFETIEFAISVVMADPNVIAVLQNLGANIIWAIGESGIRGISEKIAGKANKFGWFHRDKDPVEIGPNLREILVPIAHNNSGKVTKIKFKSSRPNGETTEIEIEIDGD